MSDDALDVCDLTSLDGRILLHLMLEGPDGQGLQSHSFIRLRELSTVRGPLVEIKDMSRPEAILRNKAHLRETAREVIRGGWLGRYQNAPVDAAFALEQGKAKERERRRSRDLGTNGYLLHALGLRVS
jgi:hypothetical protein